MKGNRSPFVSWLCHWRLIWDQATLFAHCCLVFTRIPVMNARIRVVTVIFCAIWYHLYNFKDMKNTHGGMLLLLRLEGVTGPLPVTPLNFEILFSFPNFLRS